MDNVLVIGSGGREHALAWKLAESEHVGTVYVAPGNAGTALEAKCQNVSLKENELADFIHENEIHLTVVGPEAPLEGGLVDKLNEEWIERVIGCTQAAARLESDKWYAQRIMQSLGINSAQSMLAQNIPDLRSHIATIGNERGVVLKANGLKAGKGVRVYESVEEALRDCEAHFYDSDRVVVVAQRLFGPEFSVFGLSDGEKVVPIPYAFADHKRLLDGDKGPNTGGMGAYGPVPFANEEMVQYVANNVMTPVVEEMARQGTPFEGFLYAGMMLTDDGPYVIEFNVRFGDPECQPAMMLMQDDLYEVLQNSLDGSLNSISMRDGAAACVVLASQGYPVKYQKGKQIYGLAQAEQFDGVKVFHAGTRKETDTILTNGGRVLGVTGVGDTMDKALLRAYQGAGLIEGATNAIHEGDVLYMRNDIGHGALGK